MKETELPNFPFTCWDSDNMEQFEIVGINKRSRRLPLLARCLTKGYDTKLSMSFLAKCHIDKRNALVHAIATKQKAVEALRAMSDDVPSKVAAVKAHTDKLRSFEKEFATLDTFTEAYITAALWSSYDDEQQPLDAKYTQDDIDAATLADMVDDCLRFQAENAIPEYNNVQYTNEAMAGHDFWLTRNGHGAGFWDRGLGSVGEALTEACKAYMEYNLYVGDDGKIHH